MEFTEYMLWKAIAIVALAFVLGLFGILPTDEHPKQGPSDKRHD
jgi:hypothetical protein